MKTTVPRKKISDAITGMAGQIVNMQGSIERLRDTFANPVLRDQEKELSTLRNMLSDAHHTIGKLQGQVVVFEDVVDRLLGARKPIAHVHPNIQEANVHDFKARDVCRACGR